jgi:hypothetical protein
VIKLSFDKKQNLIAAILLVAPMIFMGILSYHRLWFYGMMFPQKIEWFFLSYKATYFIRGEWLPGVMTLDWLQLGLFVGFMLAIYYYLLKGRILKTASPLSLFFLYT